MFKRLLRRNTKILIIIGFIILGSYLPKGNIQLNQINKMPPSPTSNLYKIIKVIDGDTIVVNINNKDEAIRLIGINSPEVKDPRKPVECFGKEASAKAKEILSNKSVKIESDPTQGNQDKYKRLLRYIFLDDGTNFNKYMIEEGYAFEYTYNIPYKYQEEFKDAEKQAEANQKGLWAEGVCIDLKPTLTIK